MSHAVCALNLKKIWLDMKYSSFFINLDVWSAKLLVYFSIPVVRPFVKRVGIFSIKESYFWEVIGVVFPVYPT